MKFAQWILNENTTTSQFLKQPQNTEYARAVKNEVLHFVVSNFNQVNQNNLSRLVNWFVKEIIIQKIKPGLVDPVLGNMWNNIGDYFASHGNDNVLMGKLNTVDYTYQQAISDSQEWHERISRKKRGKGAEGRVVVSLDDVPGFKGWNWVALDKGTCSQEGDAMGHCGNVNAKSHDNILSLRDPEGYPHLTFINNHGVLGEMKGAGNSKPSSKYHAPIIKLLLSNEVGAVEGGGYAPENNFSLYDLPEETVSMIKKQKTYIDNPEAFKKKFHGMIEGLRKKTRGNLLKNSTIDTVGKIVADIAERKLDVPDRMYDVSIQDESPEQVYKNNVWKLYSELLNAIYQRARTEHPDTLFKWMDQMIDSFVDVLVKKDIQIWEQLPKKNFFHSMSNIVKLDELVYRLMKEQPDVLRRAPKRNQFENWKEYISALKDYLSYHGYDLPGYRPMNHQISYEFNQKMMQDIVKKGKVIADLINRAENH